MASTVFLRHKAVLTHFMPRGYVVDDELNVILGNVTMIGQMPKGLQMLGREFTNIGLEQDCPVAC